MRPNGTGTYEYSSLGSNSGSIDSQSQSGFAFLSALGVTVAAIGMGSSLNNSLDLIPSTVVTATIYSLVMPSTLTVLVAKVMLPSKIMLLIS